MSDEIINVLSDGPVNVSLGGLDEEPEEMGLRAKLPAVLPILPVKDMSLFPRMVVPMMVGEKKHHRMMNEVATSSKLFGLVAFKEGVTPGDHLAQEDVYPIGVAAQVLRLTKTDGDSLRLMVQGIIRFRIVEMAAGAPYPIARVEAVPDIQVDDLETHALFSNLQGQFGRVMEIAPHMPEELKVMAGAVDDPGALCDMVGASLRLSASDRQDVVQEIVVKQRLRVVTTLLTRELEVLELSNKIQDQVKEGLDKTQREYYLRQQLKAIKKELGEGDEAGEDEVEEIASKLAAKDLPQQVSHEAGRELKRLRAMSPSSSEYHVITTYLDWIIQLPWNEASQDHIDIAEARKTLEADHYDLEKVKKRILEYLAVRKLNPDMKGPILCLAGPPGVGKTSLGRSIARSLGREFVRLSLGGVRDEAEIRGHRRTYVGALPGRIIQSLKRAGKNNPVFMLDEIDKLGNDFRGDPSSALLEVLDPEQNNSFSDHYLDLPFDLSKVIFVTTANVLDTIPGPLRDRMEILEIPGYTAEDKLKIAQKYLAPRQRKEHGLNAKQLTISQAALKTIIASYTREAGVRSLEREIGGVCRFAARAIAEGEAKKVAVGIEELEEILGPKKILPETAMRTSVPGVATGLAWTPSGGDILFVEATRMPGKGGLQLTGQLGDVMKESASAAVSYVRSKAEQLGIDPGFLKENDLHIHVPAGAIPKDGPSAGVTLTTALVSLLTHRSVRPDVAMTGEVTLRGLVLPVGGIKEKVLAAHRAGIKTILLPARNESDLREVPDKAKSELTFHLLERVDQAFEYALCPDDKGIAAPPKKAAGKKKPAKAASKAGSKTKAKAKKTAAGSQEAEERKAAKG